MSGDDGHAFLDKDGASVFMVGMFSHQGEAVDLGSKVFLSTVGFLKTDDAAVLGLVARLLPAPTPNQRGVAQA